MTSVIVSAITVFQYQWAVERVLISNVIYRFSNKDIALKLTDQENTAVAISSLVVIFSIIEVALAVCAAWISDSLFQPLQESQISLVCEVKQFGGIREIAFIQALKNSAN